MEPEKVKELLYKINDLIPEKQIRNYVLAAFEAASPEFFQVPASGSGKYHPPENNIVGGLGIHTVKVGLLGCEYARHYPGNCNEGVVIAAGLLHDIRKGNENGEWKKYARDHALQAYEWLEQFDLKKDLKKRIRDSVRTHMSELSFPEQERELAISGKLSLEQHILQFADQTAAFKGASFIPGVSVVDLIHTLDDMEDLLYGCLDIAIENLYKPRNA